MQFDTSGIDLPSLAQRVEEEYGLAVATLTFTPKGEEAYCFIVMGADGRRSFLRAQRVSVTSNLAAVYAITSALRERGRLHQVLAPVPTRRGDLTWRHDEYIVALFPFIAGESAYEGGLSDDGLDAAADLLARLHGTAPGLLPELPRETFHHPFVGPIRSALAFAAAPPAGLTSPQQTVVELLARERNDLLTTLQMVEEWGRLLRQVAPVAVPTHGDPNLANLLVDPVGAIVLTDWGEVALGPRERDLAFFTGERLMPFLRAYIAVAGPIRLHERLFAFYAYRWALQEIADYTTRLFAAGTAEEDDHAWEELQPYLPIRHAAIRAGVAEMVAVLQYLARDGSVSLITADR